MTLLLAFSLAAGAMSPRMAGGSSATETRAIVQAVLPAAAALHRPPSLCVARRLSAPLVFTGVLLAADKSKGDKRPQPRFHWFAPGQDVANPTELDGVAADEINRALDRALAVPSHESAARITRDLLPKGISLVHRARACPRTLGLSQPAVAGDWAFVEQSYGCGSGCGGIGLVALRRTSGAWRAVAETGLAVA
jgi:hypothetical protein